MPDLVARQDAYYELLASKLLEVWVLLTIGGVDLGENETNIDFLKKSYEIRHNSDANIKTLANMKPHELLVLSKEIKPLEEKVIELDEDNKRPSARVFKGLVEGVTLSAML